MTVKGIVRLGWQQSFDVLPFSVIRSILSRDLVVPCYHQVNDESPVHVRHLYECRKVREFRADLDLLLRHFMPISQSDLARSISEHGRPPARSMLLTVDDGLRQVSEIMAPILREKGVPAAFFLNTGFLDNRALCFRHKASILVQHCAVLGRERSLEALRGVEGWNTSRDPREFFLAVTYQQKETLDRCARALEVDFAEYLRSEQPYLTGEQVEGLLKDGFEIGGHSVDHPLYATLSLDEQLAQTRQCMAEIHSRFRPCVKSFAFPFVSDGVSPEFYRTVLDEGTADLIFCLGGQPAGGGGRLVQRFGIEDRHPRSLAALLRSEASRKSRSSVYRWQRGGSTTPVQSQLV